MAAAVAFRDLQNFKSATPIFSIICRKKKLRTLRSELVSIQHIRDKRSCSYASQAKQLVVATLSVALVLFSLLTISGDVELNPGPETGANATEGPGLEGKTT